MTLGDATVGNKFQFRCETCGYEATVSGGGDAGISILTITVVCEDCEELYDVVTAEMPERGTGTRNFVPMEPRCPVSGEHAIEAWQHPGACPRCGSELVEGGSRVLWD